MSVATLCAPEQERENCDSVAVACQCVALLDLVQDQIGDCTAIFSIENFLSLMCCTESFLCVVLTIVSAMPDYLWPSST